MFLQACFVTSLLQILARRQAGWNYVPRAPVEGLLAPWLLVGPVTVWGILLPASVMDTNWYAALVTWVGFNTLVFAFLSVLQILPPRRRSRP